MSSPAPFLCVIIPAYNAEKHLRETVYSITNQPCKDLCVIIVNDGSEDRTLQIAQELCRNDPRIHVIDQENGGAAKARNAGLNLCLTIGSPYFTFLDGDDVWVDAFYDTELQHRLLSHNKDIYYFGHYTANCHLKRGRKFPVSPCDDSSGTLKKYGIHCCYIHKTELVQKYRLYFPPQRYRTQEDTTFTFLFCTLADCFEHIDKEIFLYRSNPNSITHSRFVPSELYFSHAIPAWKWAEKEVLRICTEAGKDTVGPVGECQTMQKTYLPEFITVACQCGVSPSKIRNAIDGSGMKNLFSEENTVWIDAQSRQAWNRFYAHPWRFWIKQRAKGIAISLGQKVRHFSIVENKRYPVLLNTIYTHRG